MRYTILPSFDTYAKSFGIHHVREFPIDNTLASSNHINENPRRKYDAGFPLKIVDVTEDTYLRGSLTYSGMGHFFVFIIHFVKSKILKI